MWPAHRPIVILLVAIAFACGAAPAASIPPSRQSDCEIRANKFKATHPYAGIDDFLRAGFLYFGSTLPPKPPPDYRDPRTGIRFHVAADARQISAIDPLGRVLWSRNPFADRDMCPYRDAHPYIFWLGAPGGDFGRDHLGPFKPVPDAIANARIGAMLRGGMDPAYSRARGRPQPGGEFIGINFTSSQFGYVDIRNGDFYDMGQN